MFGVRRVVFGLGFAVTLLCQSRAASADPAGPGVATAEAAEAGGTKERSEFKPVAGLLVYPYSTDEAFGAGFQAGLRRDFLALMFRESFLRSTQYADDGALLRLKSRTSFDVSLEAQASFSRFKGYLGVGGSLRRDTWERTVLEGNRFVATRESEVVARPIAVLGLIGSAVEANVLVTLQEHPELRLGLGFVIGR